MKLRNLVTLLAIALVVVVLVIANWHVFLPNAAISSGSDATAPESEQVVPLPEVFPRDFPIYPGAKYLGSDENQRYSNGKPFDRGWFETRDDPQKVIQWYEAQLPQAGYKVVSTNDQGFSKQYGFMGDKGVAGLEIFIEQSKPTEIAVDFLSGGK